MKKWYKLILGVVVALMASCTTVEDNPSPGEEQRVITNEQLADLGCFTDLHLHLDGSLSIAAVRQLADIQGIALDMTDDELREKLQVE